MTSRTALISTGLRRLSLPALTAVAVLVSACGDPYALTASYGNVEAAFSAYAMSGTPISYPSAFSIAAQAVSRPDGGLEFDFAFDMNAAGQIVLIPVKLVALNPSGDRTVGIQRRTGTYAGISEAPVDGYTIDSVTVVKVGEPVIVEVQSSACVYAATPMIYGKMVIDSVRASERRLFGRTIVNQNCGFRSFALGFPKF